MSSNRWWCVQIDPLVTLSFLKLLRNSRKSLSSTVAAKIFWKIYFLYYFWCAQTCLFRAILDYPYEVWQMLSALHSEVREKNLYTCTSTFSALNYCGGILFKCLSYTKWCAQAFLPIFWLFAIFDRNLAKLVAPPGNGNGNSLVLLKGQSLLKKWWKQSQNRPKKPRYQYLFKVWPLNEQRAGRPERDKNKKLSSCCKPTRRHVIRGRTMRGRVIAYFQYCQNGGRPPTWIFIFPQFLWKKKSNLRLFLRRHAKIGDPRTSCCVFSIFKMVAVRHRGFGMTS